MLPKIVRGRGDTPPGFARGLVLCASLGNAVGGGIEHQPWVPWWGRRGVNLQARGGAGEPRQRPGMGPPTHTGGLWACYAE